MCLWRLQGASRVSCEVNYMVKGHPIERTVVSSQPGKTLVLAWESRGTTMADFLKEVSFILVCLSRVYTHVPVEATRQSLLSFSGAVTLFSETGLLPGVEFTK